MTNSKNSNLEGVSKGNDESAPRANDSTSDKKLDSINPNLSLRFSRN